MKKGYKGFKVLDLVTGKEYTFSYIKGYDNEIVESRMILGLVNSLGRLRQDFIVNGLIK